MVLLVYDTITGEAFAPCHPRHDGEPGWSAGQGIGDLLCLARGIECDDPARWEGALIEYSGSEEDYPDFLAFELPRTKLHTFIALDRQGEWIRDWLRLHGTTVGRFQMLRCHLPWAYLKEHERDWADSTPSERRVMVIRRSLETMRRELEEQRFAPLEMPGAKMGLWRGAPCTGRKDERCLGEKGASVQASACDRIEMDHGSVLGHEIFASRQARSELYRGRLSNTLPPSYPEVVRHWLAAVRTELFERAQGGHELPAHLRQGGMAAARGWSWSFRPSRRCWRKANAIIVMRAWWCRPCQLRPSKWSRPNSFFIC